MLLAVARTCHARNISDSAKNNRKEKNLFHKPSKEKSTQGKPAHAKLPVALCPLKMLCTLGQVSHMGVLQVHTGTCQAPASANTGHLIPFVTVIKFLWQQGWMLSPQVQLSCQTTHQNMSKLRNVHCTWCHTTIEVKPPQNRVGGHFHSQGFHLCQVHEVLPLSHIKHYLRTTAFENT